MQYKIVRAYDGYNLECLDKLEKEVEKYLNQGWKLQGGVSITVRTVGYTGEHTACQAMVKED